MFDFYRIFKYIYINIKNNNKYDNIYINNFINVINEKIYIYGV